MESRGNLGPILGKNWQMILVRGLAAIAFGLVALISPAVTILSLLFAFGLFALIDGGSALVAVFSRQESEVSVPAWWLAVVGVAGLLAGAGAFLYPGVTAMVLTILIGTWAIFRGIFEIIGAIQLRKEIEGEWLLAASGALSILFGLVLLANPAGGAVALVFIVGIYALAVGVAQVVLALRLRGLY
jgi:uncharacterized membrane protein HdeD (DUF308 family)